MSSLNDENPTRKDLTVKPPQAANVKIGNQFTLLQTDAEQILREELQVGKVSEPPKQKTIPADPAENLLGSGLGDQVQQCAMDSARNVWEHAICQFPRVDQLWYKYIHMEEMQGNVEHAREIFERWMRWMPDHQAWLSFIDFELRCNQVERARAIFEHLVRYHPKQAVPWIQYAKFEIKNGEVARARNVYERAVETIALDGDEELKLYIDFGEFEEQCKEIERARCICKFMLDHVPTERRPGEFYSNLVHFEEQYGDKLNDSGGDGKKDEGFKLRRSKRIKEATGQKKP